METKITYHTPLHIEEWNALCLLNSNCLLTSYYDGTSVLFNQIPVYFQLYKDGTLIAGIKAFEYISKKLPIYKKISSSLSMLGEAITLPGNSDAMHYLNDAIEDYIKSQKIVYIYSSGYNGGIENIALYEKSNPRQTRLFKVAYFDLTISKEDLWKRIKESHRRNINKALKLGVEIISNNDIESFLSLVNETYKQQSESAPNSDFVRKKFELLSKHNCVKLFFAKHNKQVLSAAFVIQYGKYAMYSFGGNIKNQLGAGHLLHWNIAMQYQQLGYERYMLGQVAMENATYNNNNKFIYGISRFKNDFGTAALPSARIDIISNPIQYKIWSLLKKISGL